MSLKSFGLILMVLFSSAALGDEASSKCKTLLIVTHNRWYGLDYTQSFSMGRLENAQQAQARRNGLTKGLHDSQLPIAEQTNSLEVFMLQEANPVIADAKATASALGMQAATFEVNVGIRAGIASYPFRLQEGLMTLWRGSKFLPEQQHNLFLSGPNSPEWKIPLLNFPVTLQIAERRAAVITSGVWNNRRLVFANVHIYSGRNAEGVLRRQSELKKLLDFLDKHYPDADAIFLAGDFNSERASPEMNGVFDRGFVDLSTTPNGEEIVTWNPSVNPLARSTAEKNPEPQALAFDSNPHQLDYILVRTQNNFRPQWRSEISPLYNSANDDGAWNSDHFGLRLKLQWEEEDPETKIP